MRMARVDITIPDALLNRARAEGLNVSRVAAAALSEELDRRAKIDTLDDYLRELDAALGPVSADDAAAAREWASRVFGEDTAPAASAARRAS